MGKFKDTPRYNVVSMRVSDAERKELQHIASRHSLSISDMMRQAMDIYTRYHDPIAAGHRRIRGEAVTRDRCVNEIIFNRSTGKITDLLRGE